MLEPGMHAQAGMEGAVGKVSASGLPSWVLDDTHDGAHEAHLQVCI